MFVIYGAIDPRTDQLRYVGVTTLRPKGIEFSMISRLRGHLKPTKSKHHSAVWFQSLRTANIKPKMYLIELVEEDRWIESEKFWIAYFRFIGCDLTNTTEGGDGVRSYRHTLATKLKLKELGKRGKGHPGYFHGPHTEEAKLRIGSYWRGRKRDRQGVERTIAFHRGRKRSEATKVAMRATWARTRETRLSMWITDGELQRRVGRSDLIPEGWHRGRPRGRGRGSPKSR